MFEGRFNMLKACVTYIRETQAGHGICGVAFNYAVELEREKTLFAGLPHLIALDNATDPSDDANAEIDKLRSQRFESKAALQKYCGLDEDPGLGPCSGETDSQTDESYAIYVIIASV